MNNSFRIAALDVISHCSVIFAAARFVAERPHYYAGMVFIAFKEPFRSVNIGIFPLIVG